MTKGALSNELCMWTDEPLALSFRRDALGRLGAGVSTGKFGRVQSTIHHICLDAIADALRAGCRTGVAQNRRANGRADTWLDRQTNQRLFFRERLRTGGGSKMDPIVAAAARSDSATKWA